MSSPIPVFVFSTDPFAQQAITSDLGASQDIAVVDQGDIDRAQVAVLVIDALSSQSLRVTRAIQRNGCPRVVLVLNHLDETAVPEAREAGACGFLRRSELTPERLLRAIATAAEGGLVMPPDIAARLAAAELAAEQAAVNACQVGRGAPAARSPHGAGARAGVATLTARELDVLRLLADGHPTIEVARIMCYSERTVKNVLQELTRRHGLRNRTHAVAFAIRQGLI
jgi:DNA-binding NarL/FixJ family response regulator